GESVALSKVPGALRTAACRVFGSWRDAIAAAGLDYAAIRLNPRYSDQELLELLRALARERPEMTVTQLFRESLGHTLKTRYRSVENATRPAGLVGWPVRRC